MSRTKKMYYNKQVHRCRQYHEDQLQHNDHHVTTVQPNIKQIEIINP